MLARVSEAHFQVEARCERLDKSKHDERRIGRQERYGWRTRPTQQAGWFPLSSCQGLLTRTFTTALQKYITITSILPRQEERREAEESERCGRESEERGGGGVERRDTHRRAQARESTRWMPRR